MLAASISKIYFIDSLQGGLFKKKYLRQTKTSSKEYYNENSVPQSHLKQ